MAAVNTRAARRAAKARDASLKRASPISTRSTARTARSATHGSLPLHSIHEPGARDDEQRRQEKAQQRVDPDERNVEGAESETDPERAERAMSFQAIAPKDVSVLSGAKKIALRTEPIQRLRNPRATHLSKVAGALYC